MPPTYPSYGDAYASSLHRSVRLRVMAPPLGARRTCLHIGCSTQLEPPAPELLPPARRLWPTHHIALPSSSSRRTPCRLHSRHPPRHCGQRVSFQRQRRLALFLFASCLAEAQHVALRPAAISRVPTFEAPLTAAKKSSLRPKSETILRYYRPAHILSKTS